MVVAGTSSRAFAWSVGLRFLSMLLLLLNGIIVSRVVGPDGRGYFQVMLTVSVLAASIGGLSVQHSMAVWYATRPELRAKLRTQSVLGGLLLGSVVAAVSATIVVVLDSKAVPTAPASGLVFALTLVPVTMSNVWIQRMLLLDGRPVAEGIIASVGSAAGLVVVVGLAIAGRLSATAAVGAALIAGGMTLALGWLRLRPSHREFSPAVLRSSIRVGLSFHPGQVALALLMRFDVLLVAALTEPAVVGLYAVAVSVTAPLNVFASTLTNVFLGRQFHAKREVAAHSAVRLFRFNVLLGGVLVVLAAVSAPWLVPHVWGHQFRGSVAPLIVLLPGVLALAVQRPLGNYFVRQQKSTLLNVRTLTAVMVNVGLCLMFVPPWGAVGAAFASAIAYLLYAAISVTAFLRLTGLGAAGLLPTGGDVLALWAALRRVLGGSLAGEGDS